MGICIASQSYGMYRLNQDLATLSEELAEIERQIDYYGCMQTYSTAEESNIFTTLSGLQLAKTEVLKKIAKRRMQGAVGFGFGAVCAAILITK